MGWCWRADLASMAGARRFVDASRVVRDLPMPELSANPGVKDKSRLLGGFGECHLRMPERVLSLRRVDTRKTAPGLRVVDQYATLMLMAAGGASMDGSVRDEAD